MSWSRKDIFKYSVSTLFILAFAILFAPFYGELLLAAIVALAMEPVMGRWLQPRHLRWKFSVAGILILMFTLLAFPVTYVGYRTYRYFLKLSQSGVQNSDLFQRLIEFKTKAVQFVDAWTVRWGLETQFDLSSSLEEGLSQAINVLVHVSGQLAARAPALLLSIFVFCAALYYFLAEARTIKSAFIKQRLLSPEETSRFIDVLQNSSFGTVVTSFVIALMQATIVTIGALVFETGDWSVVWALTFFCSFIPVIGAAPVALALGLIELIMGHSGATLGFVVVAVIAGTTDNLVRPFLISSNEQDLNPVVSLLAIIGALLLLGMPGLFLGPVIAGVAMKIVPTLFGPATEGAKDPAKKAT